MAHKKSGGSTSNGRDTEGRRLGLKKSGRDRPSLPAISSFVSAAPSIIPVKTSVWVKTTPFLPLPKVRYLSRNRVTKRLFPVVTE